MKKTRFASFSIAVILLSSVFSCGRPKGLCDPCQKDIDHMYENMGNGLCDPSFMQQAKEKIWNSCGQTLGYVFIGFMAESCGANQLMKADCDNTLPSGNFSKLVFNVLTPVPDTVFAYFLVGYNEERTIQQVVYPTTTTVEIILDQYVGEGYDIRVHVLDEMEEMLVSDTEEFTYGRMDPTTIRTVDLTYTAATDNYQLSFRNLE